MVSLPVEDFQQRVARLVVVVVRRGHGQCSQHVHESWEEDPQEVGILPRLCNLNGFPHFIQDCQLLLHSCRQQKFGFVGCTLGTVWSASTRIKSSPPSASVLMLSLHIASFTSLCSPGGLSENGLPASGSGMHHISLGL